MGAMSTKMRKFILTLGISAYLSTESNFIFSASRNLNQKLQLLQSPIIQGISAENWKKILNTIIGMEQAEFEGSSPMTPLSQPSPNLPPKLNKLAHVRVQHWITFFCDLWRISAWKSPHLDVYRVQRLRCDVYNHYTVAFSIDFVVC